MILKAKERGNAPQLARYLMTMRDDDHVELHDVRGFISDDLLEAFHEADAIARGTRHAARGTRHAARGTRHAARGTRHALQKPPVLDEFQPACRGECQYR